MSVPSTQNVPQGMSHGPVQLRFEKIVDVEPGGELVPFYHFKMLNTDGETVGHINFRVGDTRHITLCAGHVGYEVLKSFRGQRFSYHACLALLPLLRHHYEEIIITVDPDNNASTRTIEKLGATFLDEIDVPENDPACLRDARRKRRYRWELSKIHPM